MKFNKPCPLTAALLCSALLCRAGNYTNFSVAVYIPILLLNRYSRGPLYVWTMPDNCNDLYALPPEVTGAVKNYLLRGFPVRLDGPAQVALSPMTKAPSSCKTLRTQRPM